MRELASQEKWVKFWREHAVRTKSPSSRRLADRREREFVRQQLNIEREVRATAGRFGGVGATAIHENGVSVLAGSCVLVEADMVLTAEHVARQLEGKDGRVYFGNTWDDYRVEWEVVVSRRVPIPDLPADIDLAAFRLREPVPEWLAKPVSLAAPEDGAKLGESLVFVGFGYQNVVIQNDETGPQPLQFDDKGTRRRADSWVSSANTGFVSKGADSYRYDSAMEFVIGSLTGAEGNTREYHSGGGVFRVRGDGRYELVGLVRGALTGASGRFGSRCTRPDPARVVLRGPGLF